MNNNGPREIASKTGRGRPESGLLGLLRVAAIIALTIGVAGSLVFMFRAGQHSPRLLLILFIFWVIAPFAVLLWANMASMRWSALTRWTLYCVTMIVTLGSLAIYGNWIDLRPPGSANAFLFVAVPPLSLLFIILVVPMAGFISGRLSRRSNGN